jgi:hypothetical protein
MRRAAILAALTMLTASQAHASLTTATQDGFRITWTLMGQPNSARMIAACQHPYGDVPYSTVATLYALNATNSSGVRPLYKSANEGSTWTFVRNLPGNVTSIACSPPGDEGARRLFAFSASADTLTEYSGNNLQHSLLRFTGMTTVKAIQSDLYESLIELDLAGAGGGIRGFDTITGIYDPLLVTASSAAMVTRAMGSPALGYVGERAFARNETTNYLYYYDVYRLGNDNPQNGTWKRITSVATSDYLDQITAGSSTTLYALQSNPATPSVRKLYRATFTEVNCTDGIDNDQDSGFDSVAPHYPMIRDSDCVL